MIEIHDLYDLSAVLTKIRAEIADEKNAAILQKVKMALSTQPSFEPNQVRHAVAGIPGLNRENWYFVFHENLYVYHAVLKDQIVIGL